MPLYILYLLICATVYWFTYLAVASRFPLIYVPRRAMIMWLDPRDSDGNRTPAPLGGFGRAIGYLLGCEWCTSAYVGAAVVYVTTQYTPVPLPVLVWGAASVFTGCLTNMLGWGEEWYRGHMLRNALTTFELKQKGWKIPEED